jgi:hypothetical protein
VQRRGRISLDSAFAFLLVGASVSSCGQTVVLEDQIADGGTSSSHDGSSSRDGSSSDARCFGNPPPTLLFKAHSPEVIVALDRSSGMGGELSMVLTALAAQVGAFDDVVRFGFVDFPDNLDGCPSGCCVGEVTPPPLEVTNTNFGTFGSAAYACNTNPPGTNGLSCPTAIQRPTGAALRNTVNYYQSEPSASAQYVLLVTDGPPGGNCGNPNDCAAAENEVSTLDNNLNVRTVIIDLDEQPDNTSCLQELAFEQGQAPGGAPFYYAATQGSLNDNLKAAIGMIAMDACHLVLPTPLNDSNQLSVTYNGATIAHDSANGWVFDPMSSTVTLRGAACQSFIDNRNGLEIVDGCAGRHFGQQTP